MRIRVRVDSPASSASSVERGGYPSMGGPGRCVGSTPAQVRVRVRVRVGVRINILMHLRKCVLGLGLGLGLGFTFSCTCDGHPALAPPAVAQTLLGVGEVEQPAAMVVELPAGAS